MSRSLLLPFGAALLLLRNSRRLVRRTGAASGPQLVRGCSAAELPQECTMTGEQPQQRGRSDAWLRCGGNYLHCALSWQLFALCTVPAQLAGLQQPAFATGHGFFTARFLPNTRDLQLSVLISHTHIVIQHTEPLLQQYRLPPCTKCSAVPPALKRVAHQLQASRRAK